MMSLDGYWVVSHSYHSYDFFTCTDFLTNLNNKSCPWHLDPPRIKRHLFQSLSE